MSEEEINALIEEIVDSEACPVCAYGGFWFLEKDASGKYVTATDHKVAIRAIIMKVLQREH